MVLNKSYLLLWSFVCQYLAADTESFSGTFSVPVCVLLVCVFSIIPLKPFYLVSFIIVHPKIGEMQKIQTFDVNLKQMK